MKYKQRIITGAFALTLLVGGTSSIKAHAATSGSAYMPSARNGAIHVKDPSKERVKHTVGTITAISGTGFTFEVHHAHASSNKRKVPLKVLSVDAQTTSATTIKKDGLPATFADLTVGQKVIVSGQIHTADQIINATKVDIVTNFPKKGKATQ